MQSSLSNWSSLLQFWTYFIILAFLCIYDINGSAVSVRVLSLFLVFGVSRWWCSAASRWEIGKVEQGPQHRSVVTLHVSARHHKCPAHTNLSSRRCLVRRKVRLMQKVDKLHIAANKGAGEERCVSQSLDLSHMTNDTCQWWIIHVITVQKPHIQSLKGPLVFLHPWPSPLCGH